MLISLYQRTWDSDDPKSDGVNNMNTVPLVMALISIHAGKQWIRRSHWRSVRRSWVKYVQVRDSTNPRESVTLNGSALSLEGKDEQEKLRTELKETLAELTYAKLVERDALMLEGAEKSLTKVPNFIFVG